MLTNIPKWRELATNDHIRGHSQQFISGIRQVIPDGSPEIQEITPKKILLSKYKTDNYIRKSGLCKHYIKAIRYIK